MHRVESVSQFVTMSALLRAAEREHLPQHSRTAVASEEIRLSPRHLDSACETQVEADADRRQPAEAGYERREDTVHDASHALDGEQTVAQLGGTALKPGLVPPMYGHVHVHVHVHICVNVHVCMCMCR